MDDLIPIIIFAVIGIAKLVSSLNEKNKPKKRPASSATEKEPSGLDAIFDELAQKMAPAPRKVADWPEHVQRPDYLAEMKMQRDRTRSAPPVPAAPEPLAPENPPVITPPAMPETAAMAVPFSAMSKQPHDDRTELQAHLHAAVAAQRRRAHGIRPWEPEAAEKSDSCRSGIRPASRIRSFIQKHTGEIDEQSGPPARYCKGGRRKPLAIMHATTSTGATR